MNIGASTKKSGRVTTGTRTHYAKYAGSRSLLVAGRFEAIVILATRTGIEPAKSDQDICGAQASSAGANVGNRRSIRSTGLIYVIVAPDEYNIELGGNGYLHEFVTDKLLLMKPDYEDFPYVAR